MNHKERQQAAIRHQIPDRIPVDAQGIENLDAICSLLGVSETEALETMGIDGINIEIKYGDTRIGTDGQPLTEWGTQRNEDWASSHSYLLENAQSISEIEAFPWPDPDRYDYSAAFGKAAKHSRDYAVRGPRCSVIMHPLCLLMGQEVALVKMMLCPDVFEAAVERRMGDGPAAHASYFA